MNDSTLLRRTLDPKLDLVFFLLFAAERNRRLLIALLNAVLRPATPIVSVEVLPPRPEPAELEEKPVFLDLRVRLASDEEIDVEMQARRHVALRPRILFYWGRMYTGSCNVVSTTRGFSAAPSCSSPISWSWRVPVSTRFFKPESD